MKTTLDLPDNLVREMKIRAAREGKKLRQVAAEIFRRGLAAPSPVSGVKTQRRVSLPLIPAPEGAPQMNLDAEKISQLLEEQETQWVDEVARH